MNTPTQKTIPPIKEALRYLVLKGIVKNQTDAGERLGIPPATASRCFNGEPSYLTDKFVAGFNNIFGNIFNEEYLMSGVGTLLKPDSEALIEAESDILPIREAYNYLLFEEKVRNQTDLAFILKTQRSVISRFLSGDPRYLTANRVSNFNAHFGGIFNESYLLRGEGTLLKADTERASKFGSSALTGKPLTNEERQKLDQFSKMERLKAYMQATAKSSSGLVVRTPEELPSNLELNEHNAVTFYPELVATGSEVDGWLDSEIGQPKELWYIPGFEGQTALRVHGNSMAPTIPDGAVVAFQLWQEGYIENGKIYLIVSRTGHRMIKRLSVVGKDDEGVNIFRCKSDNPDQETYAPFTISGSEIHTLFIIKGTISIVQLD